MSKEYENVFEAICDTPSEAANLKLRSSIMMFLSDYIKRKGYSQKDAVNIFQVTRQADISAIVNGKITEISLDKLINMLSAINKVVDINIHDAA